METLKGKKPDKNEPRLNTEHIANQSDAEETRFENPSVDPGFEGNYVDREEWNDDLNAAQNPEELLPDQQNDAMNYKNDRENGAYDPKNI